MTDVALGMLLPYADGLITSGSFLRDFAATAEAAGIESLWSVEHVVVADDYEPRYPYSPSGRMPAAPGMMPMPDPLELLAFIAAVNSAPAITRAARVGDGWFPYTVSPDELATGAAELAKEAEASGRKPRDIAITVWPGSADPSRELDVDWVRGFVEAGASRLVVRPPIGKAGDLAKLPAFVERYQSDVLSRL